MECPKCQGASYLAEEEFIQMLDNVEPVKVVTKGIYVCKSCTDRFTRIHIEEIEGKRKPSQASQDAAASPYRPAARRVSMDEAAETLKFF